MSSKKIVTFEEVWARIRSHSGKAFYQIRGGEFTVGISDGQFLSR